MGFSPSTVKAEGENVYIETVSPYQNIMTGQTLPISVGVSSADPNTTFKYIFFGGPPPDNFSDLQIKGQDSSLISIDDNPIDFNNLPTFTTDASGNGSFQTYNGFIDSDKATGRYYVYVKFFFPDNTTSPQLLSEAHQIYVLQNPLYIPTPTPTNIPPIPTPTPTDIPPTPTPTNTPTPINTPTPTPTSGSTSRSTPTPTPMPTIHPQLFGTVATDSAISTISAILISPDPNAIFLKTGSNPDLSSNTPTIFKKDRNIVLILIILGSVFLVLPLIYIKIKKK